MPVRVADLKPCARSGASTPRGNGASHCPHAPAADASPAAGARPSGCIHFDGALGVPSAAGAPFAPFAARRRPCAALRAAWLRRTWRKAEPCKTRRRSRASAVAHRARPSAFGEKRAAAQASMPGVARAGRTGLASVRPACGHSLARGSRGVASGPMGAHRGGEADPRQTSPSTNPHPHQLALPQKLTGYLPRVPAVSSRCRRAPFQGPVAGSRGAPGVIASGRAERRPASAHFACSRHAAIRLAIVSS